MKPKQKVYSFVRQMEQFGSFSRGWGNGYIVVPFNHPFVKEYRENRHKSSIGKRYYGYVNMPNQECTWADYLRNTTFVPRDIRKKCTPLSLVIGFDTSHIYNNSTHNEAYVLSETKVWKDHAESLIKTPEKP